MKKFKEFAKLFETEEGQILVQKDFDTESDMFAVRMTCFYGDVEITPALKFKEESIMEKCYDKMDADCVLGILNGIVEGFN